MAEQKDIEWVDIGIIGGGINGCAIANDCAGRGVKVALFEQNDLASATSSWSTKLIHGGLRYLEQYDFKLVREALAERQILMSKAPFLIHPLEFILPHDQHLRPAWMIRLGLFLYDHLAKKDTLPQSKKIALPHSPYGQPLNKKFIRGFSYYDCQSDDARLVILNALQAQQHDAHIHTYTQVIAATRQADHWQLTLQDQITGANSHINAKVLINATGPWVSQVITDTLQQTSSCQVTLVKGSHIVVPKLYKGEHAYILQHSDKRIIFAIPYLEQFTLIGTTDIAYDGNPADACIEQAEINYLCEIINHYFKQQLKAEDIIWSFSGVRPLFAEQAESPSAISREYHLDVNTEAQQAPLISVFGGKITTHRTLAEHVCQLLTPLVSNLGDDWTAHTPYPGGDFNGDSMQHYHQQLTQHYPYLPPDLLLRYIKSYGTRTHIILKDIKSSTDLGQHFGAGLYTNEVDYLIKHEWATSCNDILWRRSKLGLFISAQGIEQLRIHISK